MCVHSRVELRSEICNFHQAFDRVRPLPEQLTFQELSSKQMKFKILRHKVCAHTLGHVDCWYLNKLFSLGRCEWFFTPANKGLFRSFFLQPPSLKGALNISVCESCSKTSQGIPRADAIIFLRDDGRHLFPAQRR